MNVNDIVQSGNAVYGCPVCISNLIASLQTHYVWCTLVDDCWVEEEDCQSWREPIITVRQAVSCHFWLSIASRGLLIVMPEARSLIAFSLIWYNNNPRSTARSGAARHACICSSTSCDSRLLAAAAAGSGDDEICEAIDDQSSDVVKMKRRFTAASRPLNVVSNKINSWPPVARVP